MTESPEVTFRTDDKIESYSNFYLQISLVKLSNLPCYQSTSLTSHMRFQSPVERTTLPISTDLFTERDEQRQHCVLI